MTWREWLKQYESVDDDNGKFASYYLSDPEAPVDGFYAPSDLALYLMDIDDQDICMGGVILWVTWNCRIDATSNIVYS